MKHIAKVVLGAVATISLVAFALQPDTVMRWIGCCQSSESIRLGAYEGDVGALGWIAQEQDFYGKVGLDVDLRGFASGKDAADALRSGLIDVAMASEYVVASRSFTETDLRILGSVAYYRNKGVVGRRDRGIAAPADLKGKRIGVTSPSGAEYSLTVFLALYGLTVKDVELVKLSPQQIVAAIGKGDIDAAITWDPHVRTIEAELGANGISFEGNGLDVYLLLVTRQDVAADRSKAAGKLLRALLLAEDWARQHPEEARAYIAARFRLDPAYVESMWSRTQLQVALPQELLMAMDSEARWLGEQDGKRDSIPNFAQFIRSDELRAVKPSVVTVVAPATP